MLDAERNDRGPDHFGFEVVVRGSKVRNECTPYSAMVETSLAINMRILIFNFLLLARHFRLRSRPETFG